MPPTKIITKYDYDNHVHPGIDFKKTIPADRSMTNQADMAAADINLIMAKYEKTGVMIDPLGVERQPMFGDFTELKNYHEALSAVRDAERIFGLLPAKVRTRFKNDPQELIEFAEKTENHKELVELGLMTREEYDALYPPQAEPPVPPVTPAPPATPPASPTA